MLRRLLIVGSVGSVWALLLRVVFPQLIESISLLEGFLLVWPPSIAIFALYERRMQDRSGTQNEGKTKRVRDR